MLRTGCRGENLDLREKTLEEGGEHCGKKSFIIQVCTAHHVLLERSDQDR
jgi:hypothetical protein